MSALALLMLVGCSKPTGDSRAVSGSSSDSALRQKLQGMTPDQRTEYVKSHLDEVTAMGRSSASIPAASSGRKP